jgi:hypothetical protein
MPRQFEGMTCVLCLCRESSPNGEHVLPSWFMDQFPESEGPFTREVKGVPETKRDGVTVRTQTSLARVKLPCCDECNGILGQRFEHEAKPVVRRLMAADGQMELSREEVDILGICLLKTWLLLAHPASRDTDPEV